MRSRSNVMIAGRRRGDAVNGRRGDTGTRGWGDTETRRRREGEMRGRGDAENTNLRGHAVAIREARQKF